MIRKLLNLIYEAIGKMIGYKSITDAFEIDTCTCNAEKGTEALSLPNVSGSLQYTDIPVSIRRSIFVTNGSAVTYVNKTNTNIQIDSALNNVDALNY